MAFLLATFAKDLSRWRRDLPGLALWLALPLMIGGLITTLIDAGGGAKPRGTLLVADLDDSFASNAISAAFSGAELGELIVVEQVSEADGRRRIDDGDASGFLVIPDGFGESFLAGEPVTLSLLTNPAQTILPGIIEDVLSVLLDAGFYFRELFADEIDRITAFDDAPADALVAEIAVAINRKIESAGLNLFPPVLDLEIVEPPAEEPRPPMSLLFMPGVVVMAVVFFANGFAADYWQEREQATLRRLLVTPTGIVGFLAGKTLAAGAFIAIISTITLAIGFAYHDVSVARLPPALLLAVLAGMAFFAWFGLLQMLAKTRRGANLLTTLALFPLLMLGGSFFPLDAMPDSLAALGLATPNGFVVARMTAELTATDNWVTGLSAWFSIVAMLASGLVLAALRLRGGFAGNA